MSQRANITPTELLNLAPANANDQITAVAWFSKCSRWAEVERYEPIKETAWLGIKQQDRLCKRTDIYNTLKSQLRAYIDIYSTEQVTPADLNPSEPQMDPASSSLTITWPSEGQSAGVPVLPPREGL